MIKKIDGFLLALAKWIVIVASFFGISRWWMIVGWITISWYFVLPQMILVSMILTLIFLRNAQLCYREDDVLADDVYLRNQPVRVLMNLALFLLCIVKAICSCNPFEICGNPYFFYYFLLCQGPGSKVTLRGMVKSAFAKIRASLAPQPLPQPVPAHCSGPRP